MNSWDTYGHQAFRRVGDVLDGNEDVQIWRMMETGEWKKVNATTSCS